MGVSMAPIRIFLVDDHEVVRRGLAALFDGTDGLEVVGEAATASSAVERIKATEPDVVVLDVRLPDGSGVEVCREVRASQPSVSILILTSYSDDEAKLDTYLAGAQGYYLKEVDGPALIAAVHTVASGGSLWPEGELERLQRELSSSSEDDRLSSLTSQERRVLELIGLGMSNREIANEMFLAEKTVKNYASSIFAKLNVSRRTQAMAFSPRYGKRGRP